MTLGKDFTAPCLSFRICKWGIAIEHSLVESSPITGRSCDWKPGAASASICAGILVKHASGTQEGSLATDLEDKNYRSKAQWVLPDPMTDFFPGWGTHGGT